MKGVCICVCGGGGGVYYDLFCYFYCYKSKAWRIRFPKIYNMQGLIFVCGGGGGGGCVCVCVCVCVNYELFCYFYSYKSKTWWIRFLKIYNMQGGKVRGGVPGHTGVLTKNRVSQKICISTRHPVHQKGYFIPTSVWKLKKVFLVQKSFGQKVKFNVHPKTKFTYFIGVKLDNKGFGQNLIIEYMQAPK